MRSLSSPICTPNAGLRARDRRCNDSLRKAPHFANAHFSLGRALAKQRRYSEARAAFEAAIADAAHADRQFVVDDEVSVWKAQSEIGSSYGYEGNDGAALEWFERALANRPLVIPVRMNRAKALERLGRYDEAEAVYKALADDEPGDVHSVDYVNYLLRCNRFAAALQAIESVLASVSPRVQASLLVTAAKMPPTAVFTDTELLLQRAYKAHPGAAEVLEALESLYRSRGDLGAVDALHRAELDAPMTLASDFGRRATRFLSLNLFAQAEAVTRAGLEVAPADGALHYNLGVVFVQTNRKEAALDELEQAGSEGDIGLRATFLRAIVLGDLGRYADAIAAVDTVIVLAPAEIDARLHRFRFATALGWDDQAEATLREALGLGDARIAAELAAWLLGKGRLREAQEVAERALAPA